MPVPDWCLVESHDDDELSLDINNSDSSTSSFNQQQQLQQMQSQQFTQSWQLFVDFTTSVLHSFQPASVCLASLSLTQHQSLQQASASLQASDALHSFIQWLDRHLSEFIDSHCVQPFYAQMADCHTLLESDDSREMFSQLFETAVHQLVERLNHVTQTHECTCSLLNQQQNVQLWFTDAIQTAMSIHEPTDASVNAVFETWYDAMYTRHRTRIDQSAEESDESMRSGMRACMQLHRLCTGVKSMHQPEDISSARMQMSLIQVDAITQPLHTHIQNVIEDDFKDNTAEDCLSKLSQLTSRYAATWIECIFHSHPQLKQQQLTQFQSFARSILVEMRLSQLFDLTVDFPDSFAALLNLHSCMQNNTDRLSLNRVTDSLRTQLQSRLLHPAANTIDILNAFVNLLRVCHVLDRSHLLIQALRPAVIAYLRKREDCVDELVLGLVRRLKVATGVTDTEVEDESDADEGGVDLNGVSIRAHNLAQEENSDCEIGCLDAQESDDDDELQQLLKPHRPVVKNNDSSHPFAMLDRWQPDSIYAHAVLHSSHSAASIDVIGELCSIYSDDPSALTRAYTMQLQSRLLTPRAEVQLHSFNVDADIACLELLKLRFGSAALVAPQVMLRDVTASQRSDAQVAASIVQAVPEINQTFLNVFHATHLSAEYWPLDAMIEDEFAENEAKLGQPAIFTEFESIYATEYAKLKTERQLQFYTQLGSVLIDVELADGSYVRNLSCSPTDITILGLFEGSHAASDDDETSPARQSPKPVVLSISDLSAKTGIDDHAFLLRKVRFWCSQGILRETSDSVTGDLEFASIETQEQMEQFYMQQQQGSGAHHSTAALAPSKAVNSSSTATAAAATDFGSASQSDQLTHLILLQLSNNSSLTLTRLHTIMQTLRMPGWHYSINDEQALHEILQHLKQQGKVKHVQQQWAKA